MTLNSGERVIWLAQEEVESKKRLKCLSCEQKSVCVLNVVVVGAQATSFLCPKRRRLVVAALAQSGRQIK